MLPRRGYFGKSLSGSKQQMVAIGRALTLNPKVLLLDKPTEGLAPIIVEELLRALGAISRADIALFCHSRAECKTDSSAPRPAL